MGKNSLLGKAIRYALRFWPRLTHFIADNRVLLSSNRTKQATKALVIGRKDWLFSATPADARALAHLYALVETAKANRIQP